MVRGERPMMDIQRYQLTWNGCPGPSKDRSLNGLLRGWGSGRLLSGGSMNSDRKRYACRNTKLMRRLFWHEEAVLDQSSKCSLAVGTGGCAVRLAQG